MPENSCLALCSRKIVAPLPARALFPSLLRWQGGCEGRREATGLSQQITK
jgi:hypothetical protein